MRLNLDCVRDLLLCIEEQTGFKDKCSFIYMESNNGIPDFQETLYKSYPYDELFYHIQYCIKSNLIEEYSTTDAWIMISDLTPEGHEFLNNIREDNVWNGIKTVSSKVGAKSLEAVTQIASNVISELIRSYFKIT